MNNTFEEIFIEHCAPLLAGIKISGLFSVKYENYSELYEKIVTLNKTLNKKDIYIKIIKKFNSSNSFYLIFAYRKTKLSERINEKLINLFLKDYGYSKCKDLNDYLCILTEKLNSSEAFPHEIGIFLGYPLNDVVSFIKEKGKNFVACGIWKTYSNKNHYEKVFSIYKKYKDLYTQLYKKGHSIEMLALAS
ncbi:MAG: DUF3793 family protein [Elusimicrobia bacterium]|nr:DUF3793 family protein [Elusimicrobiota bacterium]